MKGSVTFVERLKRTNEVKRLSEEGLSNAKIAEQLGMSLTAVKRAHRYLKEVSLNELSIEEVAEKRAELDAELSLAAEEAREMFYKYKNGVERKDKDGNIVKDSKGHIVIDIKPSMARDFHALWTDTVQKRAKLYGLDNVKVESFTQVNNQTNNFASESDLPEKSLNKIADIIVGD